jgi:nucleoid DNA-binding protein
MFFSAICNLSASYFFVIQTLIFNKFRGSKKGKRFAYPGFGTFTFRNRKARTGRNPQAGETMKIKESKTIGFKPSPILKKTL